MRNFRAVEQHARVVPFVLQYARKKNLVSVNFQLLCVVQIYMAIRTSGTERVPSKAGDQLTATICKKTKFEEK